MLQVNGKLRGKLTVAADADNATIEAAAIASAPVQRAMAEGQRGSPGQACCAVIVVPNRLVNVVLPATACGMKSEDHCDGVPTARRRDGRSSATRVRTAKPHWRAPSLADRARGVFAQRRQADSHRCRRRAPSFVDAQAEKLSESDRRQLLHRFMARVEAQEKPPEVPHPRSRSPRRWNCSAAYDKSGQRGAEATTRSSSTPPMPRCASSFANRRWSRTTAASRRRARSCAMCSTSPNAASAPSSASRCAWIFATRPASTRRRSRPSSSTGR